MTEKKTLTVVGGTEVEAKTKSKPRDLPGKQKCFVGRLVEGDSLTAAYKACYRTQGMSPKTIHNRAYELRHHGEIAGVLAQREASEEALRLSSGARRFDWVLEHLQQESDPGARDDTTAASRVSALRHLGSIAMAGATGQSMFVDRVSTEDSERSSEDVLEELRTRLATLAK